MRGQVDLGIRKALDHPAEYDRSSQDSAPLNGRIEVQPDWDDETFLKYLELEGDAVTEGES
jgi:hypothetical protein